MIHYREFTLANGLRGIVHEDPTSALAVVNVLYDVGAKDEDPGRTGFAHLFEHLMFSGSDNIPSYDEPLQAVGGENNAFTSQDLTNYYLSLPAANVETGFWLESDRMLALAFSENGLDVQRKVVVEEFKQHYLNQPYGDVCSASTPPRTPRTRTAGPLSARKPATSKPPRWPMSARSSLSITPRRTPCW